MLAGLLLSPPAAAQYRFDVWLTDQGLPQNSVQSILQTRDGYLWLTTFDRLVRFDGVRFTIFDRGTTRGLGSNRFTALFEDCEGSLWAGTDDHGLIRYRNGEFTSFATVDGLPDYWIWAIREDEAGRLLVLTGHGIAQRQGEKFVPYTSADDLSNRTYKWEQRFGRLSYYDAEGLHYFAGGRYRTYTTRDGLPSPGITAIYEDQYGALWLVTRAAGLNRFKDGVFTVYPTGRLPSLQVTAVCEDRSGNVWIATQGGGLTRVKAGVSTTYTVAQGLAAWITTIYEDREGVIWLGSDPLAYSQAAARPLPAQTRRQPGDQGLRLPGRRAAPRRPGAD